MKKKHEQIQYVEFLSKNIPRIRAFYETAFEWVFTDYPPALQGGTARQADGPEYSAFEGDYVDGGFAVGEPKRGSVLVILYSERLEETLEKVKRAGGNITKDIFSFPGGRRFHFTDPDGNELAVWSDA